MEFEFDKEIDAILRRARVGEAAALPGAHLDADEISAFAENAVSDATRSRFTAHLADCARCRKILSNVIVFNSEAETETASSGVSVETAETKVPWYRKLFAFPQVAYAMGGLVLLFSGFFGYLILQNLSPADRAVSYSANTNRAAPQTAPVFSSNSNSAANTSAPAMNSAAPMNAPSTANTAPLSASNSSVSATPAERKSAETETDAPMTEATPMATPAAKPMIKDEDADDKNLAKVAPSTQSNQPSPAGAVREDKKRDKEEAFTVDGSSGGNTAQQKMKTNRSAPENAKKQANEAGEKRSVGGKTFNNVGGIWFDAAYTNQKQKTVRRGTKDYLKLDAGLRSIADGLGGTVVVLWSGKAYRIQ